MEQQFARQQVLLPVAVVAHLAAIVQVAESGQPGPAVRRSDRDDLVDAGNCVG